MDIWRCVMKHGLSCYIRRYELEGRSNFSTTIYSFSILCLEHHYCGDQQWRLLTYSSSAFIYVNIITYLIRVFGDIHVHTNIPHVNSWGVRSPAYPRFRSLWLDPPLGWPSLSSAASTPMSLRHSSFCSAQMALVTLKKKLKWRPYHMRKTLTTCTTVKISNRYNASIGQTDSNRYPISISRAMNIIWSSSLLIIINILRLGGTTEWLCVQQSQEKATIPCTNCVWITVEASNTKTHRLF